MIKSIHKSCNLLLVVCCLLTANVSAEDPLFSYAEWAEISKNYACEEDFIALSDGKKLCGRVEKLPPIDFTFGRVTFSVEEVATVSIAERQEKLYVQYITHSGHSYFGPVAKSSFLIWVNEPSAKNPSHVVQKEVSPAQITFMILQKRSETHHYAHTALFTLILKDSQQLPVALPPDPIALSDGWKDKLLHPRDIVEIWFEGGVHGTVVQGDVRDSLGFVFVKERFLTIQIPKVAGLIRLPWERVAQIQSGQNGFRLDTAKSSGNLVGASVYIPPPTAAPVRETVFEPKAGARTSEPDAIGTMSGTALAEAAGFLAVEPQAVTALENLGNESLSQAVGQEWVAELYLEDMQSWPPALFDPNEEKSWAFEVQFESEEEIAELDPSDIQRVTEEALFEVAPQDTSEPESFELPSEEPKKALTPEGRNRIAEILAEDDLDDLALDLKPHPRVESFWQELLEEDNEDPIPLRLAEIEEEEMEVEQLVHEDEIRAREEKDSRELQELAEKEELDLLLSEVEENEESERDLIDALLD